MPPLDKKSNLVAFGKARYDINRIAISNGFPVENIICRFFKVPFLTTLNILRQYFMLLRRIGSRKILVVQYPVSGPKALPLTLKLIRNKGNKVVFFIHDINSFRYGRNTKKEVDILNSADELIVHTEAMANLLRHNNVSTPMTVLHIFDYLTEDSFSSDKEMLRLKKTVAFGGNLVKSAFLPLLCEHDFGDVSFNLYGLKGNIDLSKYKGKKYCGVFDSEHTAQIHGGWGLVWDGDSIDSCSGVLGKYLRYNLPHKLSLYLSAGMPVIVWRESAVASMVESRHLGIIVDRLQDIPAIIDNMPDDDYMQLVYNCRDFGKELRQGEMTKTVLAKLNI